VDYSLKRKEILRGKYTYRQIFTGGLLIGGSAIKATVEAFVPDRNDHTITRSVVGISLHRSVKRAVDRNRIKRWIREAYRIHKNLFGDRITKQEESLGIIFTCQSHPNFPHNLSFTVIENDMEKILKQLIILRTK
jgi:ribonuclease P protein component